MTPESLAGQGAVEIKPDSWRGAPGGYRVGQCRSGRWWWVTPAGHVGLACGVQGVRSVTDGVSGHAVLSQLESWGFNLLGAGAAPEYPGHGTPHLEALELRRAEDAPIRGGGAHLPDVFDPRWPERCAARVAAVNAGRDLAGYLSDSVLGWAQPPAGGGPPARPTLLQLCLALDASFAAYHAAWEFALAPYGGEFAAMNRAWGLSLANKEALRQITREETPLRTAGYLADHARFTREFAQRYFRGAAAAVRQADPGRLFLGAPLPGGLPAEIREAAMAHVDVLLLEAAPTTAVSAPVLVTEVEWSSLATLAPEEREAPLSRLERMHQRGRAMLEHLLRHPGVVGYTWGTYAHGERATDAPFGRGLVYADGGVAHEHVQPLATLNRAAAALHTAPAAFTAA